jgi:hypothetical protein
VLAGVVAIMALIGLVATWVPAKHALSVDPAWLMREEWADQLRKQVEVDF